MKAIEIWDRRDRNVFLTLEEVLSPLPPRALRSAWDVSDYVYPDGSEYFEIAANREDHFSRLANTGKRISGVDFVAMAKSSSQVIWATFCGYDPVDAAEAWIRLHGIDSTFWRCETSDIATRQAMIKRFKDVRLVE